MRQRSVDVLRKLPGLFRYADVAKFVSSPNVFLTRALKAGYVERIARGFYYNAFREPPGIEEVASALRTPSYISCEWALNYHNVILQSPTVCTAITLSASVGRRNRVSYRGVTIEYSKIAERLFFGFETFEEFNMATPEKALLDTVYLRRRLPFAGELELGAVDMGKLLDMAEAFPRSVRERVKGLGDSER